MKNKHGNDMRKSTTVVEEVENDVLDTRHAMSEIDLSKASDKVESHAWKLHETQDWLKMQMGSIQTQGFIAFMVLLDIILLCANPATYSESEATPEWMDSIVWCILLIFACEVAARPRYENTLLTCPQSVTDPCSIKSRCSRSGF